jgi:hypothetical protein
MHTARDVLKDAMEDVEEAGVPDDLRVVAFQKVFDLRAGNFAPAQPRGLGQPGNGRPIAPAGDETVSGGPLGAIAAKISADREAVAEVFDLRDGHPELIIAPGKLPEQVAAASKEIALLVAGGRQAAGSEEWTSLDLIRSVCSDFKRLDSGNFAKTMKSMQDVFNFRKESERKISVKVARPGWESFATLVKRLGGGL